VKDTTVMSTRLDHPAAAACWWAAGVLLLATVPSPAQLNGARQPGKQLRFEATVTPADPFSAANSTSGAAEAKVVVQRGETFLVTLRGTLEKGWHTYPITRRAPEQEESSQVSKLTFEGEGLKPIGPVHESDPEWKAYPDLKTALLEHEHPFTWSREIYVEPTAPAGKTVTLTAKVQTQVCDPKKCEPGTWTIPIPVTTSDAPALPVSPELQKRIDAKPAPVAVVPIPEEVRKTLASPAAPSPAAPASAPPKAPVGLMGTITTAVLGGLVSLLTPCVFPMIPITVSFFLKQSEARSKRATAPVSAGPSGITSTLPAGQAEAEVSQGASAILMAAVYSATIVIVLTAGGMALMPLLVRISQHYATNFALAAVFLFFALSLLGMYDITLPSWLQDATSSREGQGGLLGVFFMALTFSIISFACVGPIYGGFITLEASSQSAAASYAQWALGPLAFSVAFASPFFLLALFPSLLQSMPRAGSWMNSVKVVMGFLELAAVFKFLRSAELNYFAKSDYFTFDFSLSIYVALSLACGLYLLGLYRLPHDHEAPETIGVPRLLFSLAFLSLAVYLVPGLFKNEDGEPQRPRGDLFSAVESFLLPEAAPASPATAGKGERSTNKLVWHSKLNEALAEAKEKQKLVFIDFTGLG
jgi:thiol:disulfide interchange protein DsbD